MEALPALLCAKVDPCKLCTVFTLSGGGCDLRGSHRGPGRTQGEDRHATTGAIGLSFGMVATTATVRTVFSPQEEPDRPAPGSPSGSNALDTILKMVGRTGFEPVTSSVSGKRSPTELTARVPRRDATRARTPPYDADRASHRASPAIAEIRSASSVSAFILMHPQLADHLGRPDAEPAGAAADAGRRAGAG